MLCLPRLSAAFSKSSIVFETRLGQFPNVSWKYARLMSCSFTSHDKLADLVTETDTLLVESSDSFNQSTCIGTSHKHILNVLHRSLPVPQSNAIALIPASSISSVISSALGEAGHATRLWNNPGSRSTPDLQWICSECPSQNPPRSFKIDSQSSKVSGTEPVISPADPIT